MIANLTPKPCREHDLFRDLREQLIPRAREGALQPLLAEPHRLTTFNATACVEPLLKMSQSHRSALGEAGYWPEHQLGAVHQPVAVFCLEGEADVCIGTTERMARLLPKNSRKYGRHIVRLPARSVLVIPRQVPFSDGSKAHWEREKPESAYSRLFWMRFFPEGVMLHTCFSQGYEHSHNSTGTFIANAGIENIAGLLEESLRDGLANSQELASLHLLALLLYTQQSLVRGEMLSSPAMLKTQGEMPHSGSVRAASADAVRLACRYIQSHLREPLTVAHIAARVHLSQSHLSRMFQAELGVSIMRYVTQCRVESARTLLAHTDVSAKGISDVIGYKQLSHFSRVFTQQSGVSPAEFRKRERKSPTISPSPPVQLDGSTPLEDSGHGVAKEFSKSPQ